MYVQYYIEINFFICIIETLFFKSNAPAASLKTNTSLQTTPRISQPLLSLNFSPPQIEP